MNTIVILADTFRRDHLGAYGPSPVHTPNLDRLAREGLVFDNSFISSYPCMPARQDMWTGRLSFLRRGWSPLEYDQPDFPTLLSQAGVRTGLITDHYHYWQYGAGNYHQAFTTCEFIRGQENDNYRTGEADQAAFPAQPEKLNPKWPRYYFNTRERRSSEEYFTAQVFSRGESWLREHGRGQPFTLVLDCFDPHEPFDPPLSFAEPYLPQGWQELPVWPRYGEADRYTPMELAVIHGLYMGEVAFLDHCFGKLYDYLEKSGLLDDTAVIFTSDHGWLFGEHGWLGKHSALLYNDIVRTPLILRHPKAAPGRVKAPVQMADLMPTLLDMMQVPLPEGVQGMSLEPLWEEAHRGPNDILHREALLFGVFGGEVYLTDGEYVFAKAPNATNTPLYWYTRSHFNNWDFGQVNYWQDSIKRVEQYDGQRFPVQYANAHPGHAAPLYTPPDRAATQVTGKEDALFSLAEDPGQTHNLAPENPELADHFRALMKKHLQRYDAPEEQYQRLNLV